MLWYICYPPPPGVLVRTLIQVQSIPPRKPPQPVEWVGPMPAIGSEMTIVGVKHEVVKYSYDVEYDISVDQAMPQSRAAIDAPYGYMRCTQLTIHLKPKHREPEGDLIAGLIGGISASRTVKWNKDGIVSLL